MPDDRPMDRRRFFREGLRELLKPLANATEPIERALKEFEALQSPAEPRVSRPRPGSPSPTPLRVFLRPPGALAEQDFLNTCSRCGTCVSVCPAQAIKLDVAGGAAGGAPFVVAAEMPCVVCDGLHCMHNCPSGALRFTPVAEIDMGTAIWHEERCIRSRGEDCRICVERCPLGEAAIRLNGNRVEVIEQGCVGCGVCEHECPTDPVKAITIAPRPSSTGQS
jgi:ferredoxin-type protein NapG